MLFSGLVTTISQVAKGVIGFVKGGEHPHQIELVEPVNAAINVEDKKEIIVDNLGLTKANAKVMTSERWGMETNFAEREKLSNEKGVPDYLAKEGKHDGDLFWVPIPGYEGSYEISNFGTVRSLDRVILNRAGRKQRISGRDLKRITAGGELAYGLSKNGTQEVFNVARLVVAVFMANKVNFNRKYRVIHIDGHNGNCHINNLRVEYI